MIKVYGIKTCDSVKKALKFFKALELEIEFSDFKKTAPSTEQITDWSKQSDMKKLFNNKSRTYKDLGLSQQELSDNDKIQNMHEHPLLIKRPIIEYNNQLIVGFDLTQYEGVFQL